MKVNPILKTLTLLLAVALISLTSCSKSMPLDELQPTHPDTSGNHEQNPETPDSPDSPEPPEQDNRPGINPENQYSAVLSDPTPRIESKQLTLRFGEPGIMVAHDGCITTSFIDIDTDRRADFSHQGLAPDSTLLSPTFAINGINHDLSGRLLKSIPSTAWFILTETDTTSPSSPSATIILVIPKF